MSLWKPLIVAALAAGLAAGGAAAQDQQAAPVAAAPDAQPAFAPPSATPPTAPLATVAPSDRALYVGMVRKEAEAHGLPPDVAEAVAHIESGYNPAAVGGVGEIGLMQIRPSTAEMLGHTGGALGLFDPATNIRYSVRYLADAWRLAGGDLCHALMKYRAGHGETRMSPLSVSYCVRARTYLASLGSPLANAPVPVADMAAADPQTSVPSAPLAFIRSKIIFGVGPRRGKTWTEADDARYWQAHEARIRALTARVTRERAARIKAAARRFARLDKTETR